MPTPTRRAMRRILAAPWLPISLYLGTVGILALTGPGPVEQAVLWPWLAHVWATTLAIGAALVAVGVAAERTRTESIGHACHVFGLGLLAVVNLTLLDGGDILGLAALLGVPILRMRVLSRTRAAQREAGRLLDGDAA